MDRRVLAQDPNSKNRKSEISDAKEYKASRILKLANTHAAVTVQCSGDWSINVQFMLLNVLNYGIVRQILN